MRPAKVCALDIAQTLLTHDTMNVAAALRPKTTLGSESAASSRSRAARGTPPAQEQMRCRTNTHRDDWMVFYRDRRLGFLLERIAARRPGSSSSEILSLGQEVRERVCPALLGMGRMDPSPRPVLLHGDLWSGNVAQRRSRSRSGEPVIFDGSVYYGHGEADFGISQMFSSQWDPPGRSSEASASPTDDPSAISL